MKSQYSGDKESRGVWAPPNEIPPFRFSQGRLI